MKSLLNQLDLQGINLFCQDWGGLIGLRILAEEPERFSRAVVGNSGLPTGEHGATEAFQKWQKFSQTVTTIILKFFPCHNHHFKIFPLVPREASINKASLLISFSLTSKTSIDFEISSLPGGPMVVVIFVGNMILPCLA